MLLRAAVVNHDHANTGLHPGTGRSVQRLLYMMMETFTRQYSSRRTVRADREGGGMEWMRKSASSGMEQGWEPPGRSCRLGSGGSREVGIPAPRGEKCLARYAWIGDGHDD